MEIEVKRTITIDLDEIKKTICEMGWTVSEAIDEYVNCLDEDIYSLIGSDEYKQITEALKADGFED